MKSRMAGLNIYVPRKREFLPAPRSAGERREEIHKPTKENILFTVRLIRKTPFFDPIRDLRWDIVGE